MDMEMDMDKEMSLSTVTIDTVVISVIIPVYNGGEFLHECLTSIEQQCIPDEFIKQKFQIEVSIYDDASTDTTTEIIRNWNQEFIERSRISKGGYSFSLVLGSNSTGSPQGVGFSKNRAIEQSTGEFLCFCDADDIMLPERIFKQWTFASQNQEAIIGTKVSRIPEESTKNFIHWANNLTNDELYNQIYQSFGPTLLMPSWFCHRSVFMKVFGGFFESLKYGNPEDFIFFYQHLDQGGKLHRIDEVLLKYRYHTKSATSSILEETIWKMRLERLEIKVLSNWSSFTIWNAGKIGRRFYRSLKSENKVKVSGFCDIDQRKINLGFYNPYPLPQKVPIYSIHEATRPFIICVKTEITFDENGPFKQILKSLNLVEGLDYFYFN